MKVIAVSQRVDVIRDERRDSLDQRVCTWLSDYGVFLPVPIPNNLFSWKLPAWLLVVKPDGIVLTGGNDIGTELDRDATEHSLLTWACKNKIPVLGICRGMQMIGFWAGTPLKKVYNHVNARHTLHGEIIGNVNSYHKCSLSECPPGFDIIAWSEDNEIEAIHGINLPWEGWMWHPEREEYFSDEDMARLFELFGVLK